MINVLKSTDCKIFFRFAWFRIVFAVCFALMFVMLFTAVIGATFGAILAIFGTGVLLFRADFIISGIAPEIMLFGGLTGVFLSLFLGMAAVKIGFLVSRFFLSTRNHCDKMRERELSEEEDFGETDASEPRDDSAGEPPEQPQNDSAGQPDNSELQGDSPEQAPDPQVSPAQTPAPQENSPEQTPPLMRNSRWKKE